MTKYNIILGSQSPRRQQLLREIGIPFSTKVISTDEQFPDGMAVEKIAEYLAIEKGKVHLPMLSPYELVITADTIVAVDEQVLNKPQDNDEAITMLNQLSGRSHRVISGVCLTTTNWQRSFSEQTTVHFHPLTPDEISFYVNKFRPFDKAGGYAIQEWIGMIGISKIEGSYYNVVGLPLHQLYLELKKLDSEIH